MNGLMKLSPKEELLFYLRVLKIPYERSSNQR